MLNGGLLSWRSALDQNVLLEWFPKYKLIMETAGTPTNQLKYMVTREASI